MKLIVKDRQKGKTTGLIYTSEATGFNIVCANKAHADNIRNMAKDMGCQIPRVLTVNEIQNPIDIDTSKERQFLLDDTEYILRDALEKYLGVNIFAAALTAGPIEESILSGVSKSSK